MISFNTKYKTDSLTFIDNLKFEGLRAKVAFLDPQYNGVLDKLSYGNEGERQKSRALLPKMSEGFITGLIREVSDNLIPSGYLFLWIDKFHLVEGVSKWVNDSGLEPVDLITWDKQFIGMGYRTRRSCEYLLVLQKPPKKAKDTWKDHGIPDVWSEKYKRDSVFPHKKPLELTKRLICAVTDPGDIVLDPAAGSFNVMSACIETGRSFLGCDITTGEIERMP